MSDHPFGSTHLRMEYDVEYTTWALVDSFLAQLGNNPNREGVAYHLVGAVLHRCFPHLTISSHRYCADDERLGCCGCYLFGNTVLYVALTPLPLFYAKCRHDVDVGHRVYVLVEDSRVVGVRQVLDGIVPGRIAVQSIQSYFSQSVEELAAFEQNAVRMELRHLLEEYNKCVNETELDKSMLVEIPWNLIHLRSD